MTGRRIGGTAVILAGLGLLTFCVINLIQGDFPGLLFPIGGVLLVMAGLGLFDPPAGRAGPKR